jgi:hypothetical protein
MASRIYYLENTERNPKTGKYHNKFYRMIELDNGTFLAEWGSIGKPPLGTKQYSMNEFYEIRTKKENKGYVFSNDPGNTTYGNNSNGAPKVEPKPKYDPEKVDSVKKRLGLVVEILEQKENGGLYERVSEYYSEFLADPGTFTPERIEELNEIYNRFK